MLGDAGIGRFAGGARGLFVLQKSTSGVWSSTASNKGAKGSSRPALRSVRRRRGSAGERALEPDRGGESHVHASSEAGSSQAGLRPCRRWSPRHPRSTRERGAPPSASLEEDLRKQVRRCESMAVGCRALVDGRRPGPVKQFAFDEAAAEAGRAAHGERESEAIRARAWVAEGFTRGR